jgi:hypothetical protein
VPKRDGIPRRRGRDPIERIGLRNATLRQFYETFNQITRPSVEDLERQESLFSVVFDGEEFGAGALRMHDDDPFTMRWEKRYEEGLDLARVLLVLGLDPVEITPKLPPLPDTLVTFRDGLEQAIEVGRIMDEETARSAGSLDYMKYGFVQRFCEDEQLRNAINRVHLALTFANVPLTGEDKEASINELVSYFRIRRFLSLPRPINRQFDVSTPTLHAHGASFRAVSRPGWFFTIRQPSSQASPQIAVTRFKKMLFDKRRKNYKGQSSVWLALIISDVEQAEADVLAAICPELEKEELGQFARIIVGYERGAATIP